MNIDFITEKIHKALTSAGLMRGSVTSREDEDLIVVERVYTPAPHRRDAPAYAPASSPSPSPAPAKEPAVPEPRHGRFIELVHTSRAGTRDYKLFVPAACRGQAMPLVLMLHGCKQNPDDFAVGTRMNALAERHGFLVAYPAQSVAANGSNCWNWFERAQQSREGAEPSILAGIVGDVAAAYSVKTDQVFVAGLSAGAAMAVVLGRTHPELFAGVAAHSGLPLGAAHDVPSAFAAMAGRVPFGAPRGAPAGLAATSPTPRTIVFHGDRDSTVKASNGAAITRQAVASFEAGAGPLRHATRQGFGSAGRRAAVASWIDEDGTALVEEWVVEGGSHAWFGGDIAGSYTDASGPDASAEIVRFFLRH